MLDGRWFVWVVGLCVAFVFHLGCPGGGPQGVEEVLSDAAALPDTAGNRVVLDAGGESVGEGVGVEERGDGGEPLPEGPEESVVERVVAERPPPLPFPSEYPPIEGGTILADQNPAADIVEVSLEAKVLMHQLTPKHRFEIYAYNGMLPGPVIKAKVGDELIVHFTNNLKEATTIHWHGQRVPEAMDGVPLVQEPVKPGGKFTYRFKLRDAGTYWYHPHVRTHEQVEKGLYGMLIVQEKEALAFTRERAVLLDDILLTETGLAPFDEASSKANGRIGSQLLVNGKPIPGRLQAKVGERERWRLVNTANARIFRLEVKGAQVRVIGVDSGLLAKPFAIQTELLLSPGQRYDLEVMYEKPAKVELIAQVVVGAKYEPRTLLQVEVSGAASGAPLAYPKYPEVAPLPTRKVTREETLVLELLPSATPGDSHWSINGKVHPTEPLFTFKTGDVVLFTLQNRNNPNHPFHLHGQFFEIVSRNGLPVVDEPGLRDTVLVNIQERVVIKAYLDNPGRWMFHCHNLEHAAYGMMAHIVVK